MPRLSLSLHLVINFFSDMFLRGASTILLLVCSNIFMTLAWYGHIAFKSRLEKWSLAAIVVLSWGVALFEYCFQVPANRLGSAELGVAGGIHAVRGAVHEGRLA